MWTPAVLELASRKPAPPPSMHPCPTGSLTPLQVHVRRVPVREALPGPASSGVGHSWGQFSVPSVSPASQDAGVHTAWHGCSRVGAQNRDEGWAGTDAGFQSPTPSSAASPTLNTGSKLRVDGTEGFAGFQTRCSLRRWAVLSWWGLFRKAGPRELVVRGDVGTWECPAESCPPHLCMPGTGAWGSGLRA